MKCWKRVATIAACISLATAHLKWPSAKVDSVTVGLLLIATVVLFWPELEKVLPYIRKVKIGSAEIELAEAIQKLGVEVERAQESASAEGVGDVPQDVYSGIAEILAVTGKDPRAALLLLAARLEREVRVRLEEAGVESDSRFQSLPKMVEVGVARGLFPASIVPAVRDFWQIRNKVAHGMAFQAEDSTILSLISLGTDLLKVISTGKPNP